MKWEYFNDINFEKNITEIFKGMKTISKNKIKYYNIPCAFDIETSSFYENGEKRNIMYVWQLGINNNYVVIGRTWPEFIKAIYILCTTLKLEYNKKHLIIYVHNLSYEFQYIRKIFEWCDIFALDERKVCYAISNIGVEFKCSYILSGDNLQSIAEKLKTHKIKKLMGDLDYTVMRHSKTPLSDEELQYCINDVLIVMYYIQEKIGNGEKITKIPLTKTGYVRKYIRNECLPHGRQYSQWCKYRALMNQLQITPDEYIMSQKAFQGGFTHANARHSNKIINDVDSLDFTSSYPAVMVVEKYPMSRGFKVDNITIEKMEYYNRYYCTMFDIAITNIDEKLTMDHPLSTSRCHNIINPVYDNGRIVSADYLITTVTNIDYEILKEFYSWEDISISNFYYYYKGYLPKPFIKSILTLYKDKTELKGVSGSEHEYMLSKELLNSCYGMCVTNIVRPEIKYINNEWITEESNISEKIDIYNKSKKRFLSYIWGIFVTAYARYNLFQGIKECGKDYIYSDTDSIKLTNYKDHKHFFDNYNNNQIQKIYKASTYHNISIDYFIPETKNGIKKMIGAWDWETEDGAYKEFKTLGAKRYIYKDSDNSYHLTMAGVGKTEGIEYIKSLGDPMKYFTNDLYIPKGHTGKKVHTYIDNSISGTITDYNGVSASYKELSCVHLEECDYSLSLTRAYIDYILNFKEF